MNKQEKIYVAGHRGLVGSAIVHSLRSKGYDHIVTRTHQELDLTDQQAVTRFFDQEKPDYVILAAAYVGGILANSRYRADFIYRNMQIQNNVIHQSYLHDIKKLLFLGSTCIYPGNAPQPMPETCLLTSPLEYSNEPYAIAKIAGLKMCESYNLQYGTNFIAVMPTNLYGPNDNFDLERGHVLPSLARRIQLATWLEQKAWTAIRHDFAANPVEGVGGDAPEAAIREKLQKYGILQDADGTVEVQIWGTGTPLREFLWSEDMADACVFLMEQINFSDLKGDGPEIRNCHLNIGSGKEITIRGLAELIAATAGFKGNLTFNTDKPDGTMRKLTDVSRIHRLGWHHQVELEDGVARMLELLKQE